MSQCKQAPRANCTKEEQYCYAIQNIRTLLLIVIPCNKFITRANIMKRMTTALGVTRAQIKTHVDNAILWAMSNNKIEHQRGRFMRCKNAQMNSSAPTTPSSSTEKVPKTKKVTSPKVSRTKSKFTQTRLPIKRPRPCPVTRRRKAYRKKSQPCRKPTKRKRLPKPKSQPCPPSPRRPRSVPPRQPCPPPPRRPRSVPPRQPCPLPPRRPCSMPPRQPCPLPPRQPSPVRPRPSCPPLPRQSTKRPIRCSQAESRFKRSNGVQSRPRTQFKSTPIKCACGRNAIKQKARRLPSQRNRRSGCPPVSRQGVRKKSIITTYHCSQE